MHSQIGPWTEAQEIYIHQAEIPKRLEALASESRPSSFVIYDVGLGIAANALAAIDHLDQARVGSDAYPPVTLVSFENDLDGIQSAMEEIQLFPFLVKNKSKVTTLLNQGYWKGILQSGIELHWILKHGDLRDHLPSCPAADLILFDLYSPKSLPHLWGYEMFRWMMMKSHRPQDPAGARETLLITYSASTAVRAALLLNGFFVGKGISTAAKRETTLATFQPKALARPLTQEWLSHWTRSSNPLPQDLSPELKFMSKEEISRLLAQNLS